MGQIRAGLRRWALRLLMPVLRRAPSRASAALIDGLGWVNYRLLPGAHAQYLAAANRGRAVLGGDWNPDLVARRLASGQVHGRCRDRLLDGLTDEQALDRFEVTGREHLDAALKRGRGVVLLGNHFGAHLHPSHWLHRAGYDLRLFMERPRHVSRFLTDQFGTDGPLGQSKLFISRRSTPNEAAGSILRASRILNAGMILQIAGDVRWEGSHTAPGAFLGATHLFSTTWVVLAAMTGAPVVSVFCRSDGQGRYHLAFLPSFRVPPEAARIGQASPYVQRGLDAIVEQVRQHPDQSNDYFQWPRPEVGLALVA